jgi:hypothetical protein
MICRSLASYRTRDPCEIKLRQYWALHFLTSWVELQLLTR